MMTNQQQKKIKSGQRQPMIKKKRLRGKGVINDDPKQRINLTLSKETIELLEILGLQYRLSKSEVIDQTFRGEIKL